MSYIKREDAKNAIFDYICEQTVSKYPSVAECKAARSGAEGAFNEIDYVPTADVVEVVRCKDCKWWSDRGFDPILNRCDGYCDRPLGEYYECDCNFITTENDYCSYGERKEG